MASYKDLALERLASADEDLVRADRGLADEVRSETRAALKVGVALVYAVLRLGDILAERDS